MSYSDILKMRNSSRKILCNPIYNPITKKGLVMWLDGKDFKNNPQTTLWQDKAKNNPINYTNLISNGDFGNGITGWLGNNISTTNNIATCTATVQYDGIDQQIPSFATYASHILYARAFINMSVYNTNIIMVINDGISQSSVTIPATNQFQLVSSIRTISPSVTGIYVKIQDGRTSGWTPIQSKQFECVDLTAMFCGGVAGTGLEPSQSWCDANLPFVVSTGIANIPLYNIVQYNPNTWAEWTTSVGVVSKSSTGVTLTGNGSTSYISMPTTIKAGVSYGFLYNVVSLTMSVNTLDIGGGGASGCFADNNVPKVIGYNKYVQTSINSNEKLYIQNGGASTTDVIEINNYSIFELQAGSQIAADFSSCTGSQLAAKYTMANNAIPSNFAYTTANGSDNVSGVVFDGIVDTLNCGNGSVLNWTIGTLEMKFVPLTFNANYARLFSKEATTGCDSYALAIDPSLHKFYFFTNGGVSACTSNYDCALNTPVHVVFTCDGTNYRIYVNGALDSTTAIGANVITITANNLLIGNNPPNTRQANIDCKFARVYNRALTQSEISRNFNA